MYIVITLDYIIISIADKDVLKMYFLHRIRIGIVRRIDLS